MVPSTYFSVQQVLLLLRQLPAFAGCAYIRVQVLPPIFRSQITLFPSHTPSRPQMLQSCLGAIVDLENIHLVVDGLFTADERNEGSPPTLPYLNLPTPTLTLSRNPP